jgi:5-methylcytosine-specific restriction enzyme subunit McrC
LITGRQEDGQRHNLVHRGGNFVLVANNLITLFERQAILFQSLELPANDPLLNALDRLNQSAGKELIQLERNGLRATQYVGVIQAGAHLIQILPKIDCDPNGLADAPAGSPSHDRAVISAARNFMHMLRLARRLKLQPQALATLRTSRGTWLEMLTRLFTVELATQLQQGFHQDYVRRDDMLPYVRGRWNIARQFIHQPNLAQGLDVSYDDYSADTLLNRVFRLTVDRLQSVTHDPQNRQMLANLETWLLPVQLPVQLNFADLNRIEFTRLNERFQPAFQLACLFLEGQTVQLLAGGQRAYAFVFDMDRLFEQFVASLLQTHARRILPEGWAGSRTELKGGEPKKYLIQLPNPAEKPLFLLQPDILLKSMGIPLLIIDTKNKALPLKQSYRAVAETDVYQMLAYAIQYRCPNVLLLYPHTFGAVQAAPYCLPIQGTSIRLFVATLDLHQPLERLDRLVQDFRGILDYIYLHEDTRLEVLWPA